ncbi:MAG: ubiquinone/menaquinone biosynthesis methyltransferase [Myxococcota bacterium]
MPPRTAPPSALRDALEHREDKQELVDWVFSRVADRYDLGNDIMSMGWHTRWKRRLVASADIQPHHRVLDIACGTGDTTFMLGALACQGEVVGTDINTDMMALAEHKRPQNTDHVRFLAADATSLPLEDASFDRITCTYAGRGFPDWPGVLREAHRLLKPGGTFWNLDFARPPVGVVDWGYRAWLATSGAVLGVALHGHPKTYIYIAESLKAYKGQRWLHERMKDEGFEAYLEETFLGLMAYNHGKKVES